MTCKMYTLGITSLAASLKEKLIKDLDFAESCLPKSNITGKRVGIGEIGYPIAHIMERYNIGAKKAELVQARLALISAQVNLEWGVPFWLWWGLHNNEPNHYAKYDCKFAGFAVLNQGDGSKRRLIMNSWRITQEEKRTERRDEESRKEDVPSAKDQPCRKGTWPSSTKEKKHKKEPKAAKRSAHYG